MTAIPFNSASFIKTLSVAPGVYQMLDVAGQVIYVGKAKNLKKRVSSYFLKKVDGKTASLVKKINRVETIITQTENEALLLENTLIKKYRPRYNIIFRDDKSYPYLFISDHENYPRLSFYRGTKKNKGHYFGPYPSTNAVRETLNLLQKIFRLRSCQDDFFKNRTRPCLQYQIKRCTAPCVNYITPEDYAADVQRAILFLEGKNHAVIAELIERMENASSDEAFEDAARLRDQIASLRQIQQQQSIVANNDADVDVFALAAHDDVTCIQVMMVRGGRMLGGKTYFPSTPLTNVATETLAAFMTQYYLDADSVHIIPKQILTSHALHDATWINNVFSERAQHAISITHHPRQERARWLQMALRNAKENLAAHLATQKSYAQRYLFLQEALQLENLPQKLECFDVSHSLGESTVASCVVFDQNGARKSDYRRFNIEGITKGDDYAALHQALRRRYTALKENEGVLPDILIIDGGKGQLKQAEEVLEELQITGITILGIAKGPTRKAGLEVIFLSGTKTPLSLQPDSPALHLLQQIRDEAHRFAITGHRAQRAKTRQVSLLEDIPGIGAKRRRDLLQNFGGLQELKRASMEEIAKVPGISRALAEKIYLVLYTLHT